MLFRKDVEKGMAHIQTNVAEEILGMFLHNEHNACICVCAYM